MLSILTLGFLIGMQHALEADHVAAVSSLASGQRSLLGMVRHGVTWGIGHSLTLLAVTGLVILLGPGVGAGLAPWLEVGVGVMLVGLGGHVLWRLILDRIHFHRHRHGDGTLHFHAHSHRGEPLRHDPAKHHHEHPRGLPWRTLLVGLMHGMAGSAALVVLALSQAESALEALGYVLFFGLGTILGMALLSAVIATPLIYSAKFLTWANRGMQGAIGLATVAVGLWVLESSLALAL